MAPWALVSPASRGIGLELARRLLRTTDLPLIATARGDLDEVRERILDGAGAGVDKERLEVLKLDVCDESTIAAAALRCNHRFPPPSSHLHLAFILPGILHPEKSPSQLDEAQILHTFRVNTIGPLLMMKHFSPFLPRKSSYSAGTPPPLSSSSSSPPSPSSLSTSQLPPHSTFALLSARVGSISANVLGGWYSYRCSKAALNQATKTFDNHLRSAAGDKAIAIALHPGTVKTGLSREFWANVKEGKLFSAEFAAERLVGAVCGMGERGTGSDGVLGDGRKGGLEEVRGRCWDWEGKEILP